MSNQESTGTNLERLFVEVIDEEGGEGYEDFFSTRSREGIFSPALTMWLMLCQRTQERHSLAGALESIARGSGEEILARNKMSKRVSRGELSLNSGGFSRARTRLGVSKVKAVCELVTDRVLKNYVARGSWDGKRVFIMDGTRITLANTEAIKSKYPSCSNQYGEIHNSQLLCMCFHDLFSGVALSPHYGPYRGSKASSEQALCREMIVKLAEPALLMGDRNFGVYSVVHEAMDQGHEVLVRLTETRAFYVRGKPLGEQDVDEEIEWHVSKISARNYPALAGTSVKGRYIQKIVRNPGCKPLVLHFFTTSTASVKKLLELYRQRERIENDIRSLKHSIGLEMLYARTPEMLEKELLLGVAAYNLLRALIASAAKQLDLEPRAISFSRAAALIRIFGNKLRDAHTAQEIKDISARYLNALRQSKLPNRAYFRVEPRKLVRKRRTFPTMTKSRAHERQLALNCLKEHGTRGSSVFISKKY